MAGMFTVCGGGVLRFRYDGPLAMEHAKREALVMAAKQAQLGFSAIVRQEEAETIAGQKGVAYRRVAEWTVEREQRSD